MRRWWWLTAALACVVATACGGAPSAAEDGPAPGQIGKVGDCYGESSTEPINCRLAHTAETVFVKDAPPGSTSEALMPCREATVQYLGQDFNTRLDVRLWVAGDLSWYRCDVLLRESTKGGSGYQTLTGSLKGVLDSGASVDLQSCLSEPYDPAGDQVYVPCSESHIAQELVQAPAIGTMDEKYPVDIASRATRACNATASAAHVSGSGRSVEAYYPKNADAWSSGERTADCWVTADTGVLPPIEPASG
jgi:putative regulator of septum formation